MGLFTRFINFGVFQWSTMIPLMLIVTSVFLPGVDAYIKCPPEPASSEKAPILFDFKKLALLVTSHSQKFSSYSLVDIHRRTAILQEYLMVGYFGKPDSEGVYELIQMVIHGEVDTSWNEVVKEPDLIHQNLEKELFWTFFNSTGLYPSMTVINTTTKYTVSFHTGAILSELNRTEHVLDTIGLHAMITEREFFEEPQVPLDAVFEIPVHSRVLRRTKTMIQYNSYTLWRWRLSDDILEWSEVLKVISKTEPVVVNHNHYFDRIDNPCIKDLFLASVHRQDIGVASSKYLFLASPLIQTHFRENWFYDMSSVNMPWKGESVEKVILTNDHLVVLSSEGLWVSQSLNLSNDNLHVIQDDLWDRPLLHFSRVNPCATFSDDVICFSKDYDGGFTAHKLFYNPVCYLFQFPNYDDYIIFVEDGTNRTKSNEQGFSIIYAAKPYTKWNLLFANAYYYLKTKQKEHWVIKDIAGIFFNHHLRQFDITVQLRGPKDSKLQRDQITRFVLPEKSGAADGHGEIIEVGGVKRKVLNDIAGEGFLDFDFPATFQISSVVVNGESMDVFFTGNQLWIAEAAGPFVYASLTGLSEVTDSLCNGSVVGTGDAASAIIRECSFNQPDRTYICLNEDRRLILAGRIGSAYSPLVIEVDKIPELLQGQKVRGWPRTHFCNVLQKTSLFFAGFSGRILMWHMHDSEDLKNAQSTALGSPPANCEPGNAEPVICNLIKEWNAKGCNVEKSGTSEFRMLAINPLLLTPRQRNTDGPLVPFFLDSNAALLFEGIVPPHGNNYYVYFSEVNIGQNIYCRNYDLLVQDARNPYLQHNCELFMRHIKPVHYYLDGFRRCLFVTVMKSIPMLGVPADIVVLVKARSNKALIKIDDHLNIPKWAFTEEHIGQTLYLPGNFSILLAGFPKEDSGGGPDYTVMEGYTTQYFQHEQRLIYHAFYSFLMDMSTQKFREVHKAIRATTTVANEKARLKATNDANQAERDSIIKMRKDIQERWEKSPYSDESGLGSGKKLQIFEYTYPPNVELREDVEAELLKVRGEERHPDFCINLPGCPSSVAVPWTPVKHPVDSELASGKFVEYNMRRIWYVAEGECNYILSLSDNKVLKSHGGRISLDLHDSLSLEVVLKSTTTRLAANAVFSIGKIMMYRPLLVITSSNPDILRIETTKKLQNDPQSIQLMMTPTGYKTGVAVVTIRSVVSSLKCQQATSVTFIVQVHREHGRRLHAEYPISLCKAPKESGAYPRPWVENREGCIDHQEILNQDDVLRYHASRTHIIFIKLPDNYRPPSAKGVDIPLTKNVYNADPSKPHFKAWYKASRDSIKLTQCAGKNSRKECECTDSDRISDDVYFSECKQKAFFTRRSGDSGKSVTMTLEYDRVMRDSDQNNNFFTPKLNWSVYIEEVNGRKEWFITHDPAGYIDEINSDPELNQGKIHYDMKSFNVTLLGTGLFHFKATLGKFESFSEVTGHFILYADPDELNHIHMFIIMLVTLVFCFTMVFLGFVVVRKRLSSQLPIQPMSHKKKLKLL